MKNTKLTEFYTRPHYIMSDFREVIVQIPLDTCIPHWVRSSEICGTIHIWVKYIIDLSPHTSISFSFTKPLKHELVSSSLSAPWSLYIRAIITNFSGFRFSILSCTFLFVHFGMVYKSYCII